ncbi:MAG: hypothetical protein IE937_01150 [Gammaproteobacteria bacterium]|nr:hypothetical protein [Gammaproteobacteria bacterium]
MFPNLFLTVQTLTVSLRSNTLNKTIPTDVQSGDLIVRMGSGFAPLKFPARWTTAGYATSYSYGYELAAKISDGTEGGNTVVLAGGTTDDVTLVFKGGLSDLSIGEQNQQGLDGNVSNQTLHGSNMGSVAIAIAVYSSLNRINGLVFRVGNVDDAFDGEFKVNNRATIRYKIFNGTTPKEDILVGANTSGVSYLSSTIINLS